MLEARLFGWKLDYLVGSSYILLEAIIFCSAFLYDCKLGYEKRFRELCEEEFEEICKASILNLQGKYLKKYAMQVLDRLNICKVTFFMT